MKYRFCEKVFHKPYAPYYDQYRGHVFEIDHYHPEDSFGHHVWLSCVSDPDIVVAGYVEMYQLEKVQ